jgi:hypothetical protein
MKDLIRLMVIGGVFVVTQIRPTPSELLRGQFVVLKSVHGSGRSVPRRA